MAGGKDSNRSHSRKGDNVSQDEVKWGPWQRSTNANGDPIWYSEGKDPVTGKASSNARGLFSSVAGKKRRRWTNNDPASRSSEAEPPLETIAEQMERMSVGGERSQHEGKGKDVARGYSSSSRDFQAHGMISGSQPMPIDVGSPTSLWEGDPSAHGSYSSGGRSYDRIGSTYQLPSGSSYRPVTPPDTLSNTSNISSSSPGYETGESTFKPLSRFVPFYCYVC